MLLKFSPKWFLFCLPLLTFSLSAAIVADLFTANVVVESQSQQQLANAQREAMEKVLVKVSGQSNVLENEVVQTQLSNAASYVLQYGYLNTTPKQIEVQFDQQRITRLLRQAEQPVWGKRRPLVLMWLATEQQYQREIINDASERAEALKLLAAERGLPIVLPLMDLDDTFAVSASDIWGGFLDPLLTASARYGADAMVVVRLYPEGEQTTSDWQFYDITDGQQMLQRGGQMTGGDVELNQALVTSTADWLASKYAVKASALDTDKLEIVVENVADISVYLQLEKLLDSFVSVSKAELVRQQGQHAYFSLRLVGSTEDVLNELELDNHLQAVGVASDAPDLNDEIGTDSAEEAQSELQLPGEVAAGDLQQPTPGEKAEPDDPIAAFYGDDAAPLIDPDVRRYRWVP